MFFAHSTTDKTRGAWQRLDEHLIGTAHIAEQLGEPIGISRAARLAGLLHDLGKYTREFQARLEGTGERVDHSTAGAAVVSRLAGSNDDKIIAELIAYAIAGHHAGLPDKISPSAASLSGRLKEFSEERLDPAWRSEISPEGTGLMPPFKWHMQDRARAAFQLSLLGRMIFSCLVDADFKDTEAFYARIEGRQLDREWPTLQSILPELGASFERYLSKLPKAKTPVNRLRTKILEHVRSLATNKPGLFTLTVPTGGGKTLTSLGFALDHARAHGLRRIIYSIPFTSIIDQTAAIFRTIFGEDVVLEHHSAIDEENVASSALREAKDKLKLAMEDWAAPIIVTTNVQLFESLFAARPSPCRKLHNIARSIIVLDEAQTLPRSLLVPVVWALRELAENYGCTVVLCTATQPALDQRKFPECHPAGLPLAGRELAPDPVRLARELRRVRLTHAGTMSDSKLIKALAREKQALVIVNSRKHALSLYRRANETGLDGLIHLTTRQYAAHRRKILEMVRQRLKEGSPCRLIATSLVEAGVDLDFPRVWRAEAGLDQIAQAAGRCNREGLRPVEESVVTIFHPTDDLPPPEIKGLSGDLTRVIHKHGDLLSPNAIEDFFGEVYWRLGKEGLDTKRIIDDFRLARGDGGLETNFAYRTVADKFRMIESGMAPVIVVGDDIARKAVEELRYESIPSGVLARRLQPYVVQVPPKARQRLLDCGHVRFFERSVRGGQFAVLVTENLYQQEIGLVWEDAEFLDLEQWVV